jgi:palmitoyl-protein thioesterase
MVAFSTPYVLLGSAATECSNRRRRACLLVLNVAGMALLLAVASSVHFPVAPILRAASATSVPRFVLAERDGDLTPVPIVLLHGVGDSSTNQGMASLCESVRRNIPGTYVVCASVADGTASFTMPMEAQIDALAASLAADTHLAAGFHAIGLSQGGLVLRGYVERCVAPPVRRLITISTPHSGIGACPAGRLWAYLCPLFSWSPYSLPITFSEYWKDVTDGRDAYLSSSRWLADVNNERRSATPADVSLLASRRAGMLALERYVLVEALNDSFVVPRQSTTHGYWAWGHKDVVLPMRQTPEYLADNLALRSLDQSGRLRTLGFIGDHLEFNASFWVDAVLAQLQD